MPNRVAIVDTMKAGTQTKGRAKGGENARGRVLAREGVVAEGGDIRERVEESLSTGVDEVVLQRGLFLYLTGVLTQNSIYPWIFMVSGSKGDQVYRVDLLAGSCGCKGFEVTRRVCKHIVAAGAKFVDQERGEVAGA